MSLGAGEDVDEPLDALFRMHYARLVRALTLVSGSREQAADAVQEAFVKAHLAWWRIKRYDDPIGWIRRVAINGLRDAHRRSKREARAIERLASQHAAGDASSKFGNPGADVSAADVSDDELRELIADLPRQQRLAVTLFYVDELSVAEVATAMSLTAGAVKFHLHQGRQKLRASLPAMWEGGVRE